MSQSIQADYLVACVGGLWDSFLMNDFEWDEPVWEDGNDDECEHENVDYQAAEGSPYGWSGRVDIYDECMDCGAFRLSGQTSVL